ncbi:MAG: DoxX family protein [Phycisphaerales bacterium JB043]
MSTTSIASPTTTTSPSISLTIVSWIARIIAAAILAMAALPKLTGDPVSVALFETLGAGSAGMYATGVLEAIAIVLLLVPKSAVFGGVLGMGLMGGAIVSHVAILGIDLGPVAADYPDLEVPGVEMFAMAIVVLLASTITTYLHRKTLIGLLTKQG